VMNLKSVQLIIDGSCQPANPGNGGWCCILQCNGRERVLTGGHPASTNSRMELSAALFGLRALREPCEVELITDSMYVAQGITEYLPKWRANSWRTASGKEVKNQDLWLQLAQLLEIHTVHCKWTRAHSDHADQNRADQLAGRAARDHAVAVAG